MAKELELKSKEQLFKYKGGKCSVCGMGVRDMLDRFGTFNRMFEFHHLNPELKSKDYDNLIKQSLSSKQIDEVDKCILLCRNCHGLVHAQNNIVNIRITFTYENRTVSQDLNGWMIFDKKDKRVNFLAEGKLLIEPYIEKCVDNTKNIIFGVDVHSSDYIIRRLKELEKGGVYSIFSAEKRRLVFRVENLNNCSKPVCS